MGTHSSAARTHPQHEPQRLIRSLPKLASTFSTTEAPPFLTVGLLWTRLGSQFLIKLSPEPLS